VGEGAHREEVDAGRGVRRRGAQGEAARGLQERAAAHQRHGLLALAGREVVQQDQVGARVQDLAQLVQGVDLDLDRHVGEGLPDGREGLGDAAGGDHVVVLDEGRVRERHAVVDAAARTDRELLQGAQSWRRLAGVAHARAGALQDVRPRARERRDAGQAAQQVQRAALGRQQVAGAGRDAQEPLPGHDAVAVLDVPLDLELVGADHGDDRLGDPQARHDAGLAGGEVGGGDGLLGDGRDRGHVHAVVEVLLDGQVRDVLDLDGVEAGVGEEPREVGVEPALGVLGVLGGVEAVLAAAAAVAAATAVEEGKVRGAHFCHCSWGLGVGVARTESRARGSVGGNSGVSVVCTASVRSGLSRTTMWRRQVSSSRSPRSSRQWQPRVSSRRRAAVTRTRATHRRLVASQVSTPGSAVLPCASRVSRASACSRCRRSAAVSRETAERSTPAPSVMIRWIANRASAASSGWAGFSGRPTGEGTRAREPLSPWPSPP
jgi:hypothetical protein